MTSENAIIWLHSWYELMLFQSIEEQHTLKERWYTKSFWENPTEWALSELRDLEKNCNGYCYSNDSESIYNKEKQSKSCVYR